MSKSTLNWVALAATTLVLFAAWDISLFWPAKVLVVFFHEISHAAAALATGGEVLEIGLSPSEGGHTLTRGGVAVLILNAGYLGSLGFGACLIAASRAPRSARRSLWALVCLLVLATVLFVRPFISFAGLYSSVAAAALAALIRLGGPGIIQFVPRALGVFSVLYAFKDIVDDVFLSRAGVVTDASLLEDLTYIPAAGWGIAWFGAGLALLVAMRRSLV